MLSSLGFLHGILVLCSLVSFLPAFDTLNIHDRGVVLWKINFGRLTVFLRSRIFQISVLKPVQDMADAQGL